MSSLGAVFLSALSRDNLGTRPDGTAIRTRTILAWILEAHSESLSNFEFQRIYTCKAIAAGDIKSWNQLTP